MLCACSATSNFRCKHRYAAKTKPSSEIPEWRWLCSTQTEFCCLLNLIVHEGNQGGHNHNYRLARLWPPQFSRWRSVTVDKLKFSQNLSGVGPQHHLHSKCEPKHSSCSGFSWQMPGIFSTTERIASRVSMSAVVLDFPNLNYNLKFGA